MTFSRVMASNAEFRHTFVEENLIRLRNSSTTQELLDVGAGLQRYKQFAEELGYTYSSHDFLGISPDPTKYPGLQDKAWDYPKQTFSCDILEIPNTKLFDLVLCTEVLEHVPDPVEALKKLETLTAPGGIIVPTVPLSSLIHQAPFYFASGLSPYFFSFWCEKLNLNIEKLVLSGDYTQTMNVEIERLYSAFKLGRPLIILNKIAMKLIRNRISDQIQSSTGFNTFLVARKVG